MLSFRGICSDGIRAEAFPQDPATSFPFSLCFVSGIVGISANALVVRPSLLNSFAL